MKGTNIKRLIISSLLICAVCSVFIVYKSALALPNSYIVRFEDFLSTDNNTTMPELDIDLMSTVNGETFYITRQAGYINARGGLEEINKGYYQDGEFSFKINEDISSQEYLISPVLYVQNQLAESWAIYLSEGYGSFDGNEIMLSIDRDSENIRIAERKGKNVLY